MEPRIQHVQITSGAGITFRTPCEGVSFLPMPAILNSHVQPK
jgi:hypothetical protein